MLNKFETIDILRSFKKSFSEKYGIISIGIFGSVARNQSTEKSDIDICIKTVSPNPFVLIKIKEELESLFHRKVDIVRIRETMNSALKKRIEKEGIYV